MPPKSNACICEAGKAPTLNPTVWYFQQMSLFTGLKARVPVSCLPHIPPRFQIPPVHFLAIFMHGFLSSATKKRARKKKKKCCR